VILWYTGTKGVFFMVKKKKNTVLTSPPLRAGGRQIHRHYTPDYKIKTVKLHLVDDIPLSTIAGQSDVSVTVLSRWVRQYREKGPSVFTRSYKRGSSRRLPAPVKKQIVSMKEAQPTHGVQRISDLLRRMFFMKASHETVRRVLHEESLLPERRKPRAKRVAKTAKPDDEGGSYVKGPNLMWQSDISVITWRKQSVYLIGFIDDFSRFVTGLGLYMTQKADNVLEVFRRAASEYKSPVEMLTDNGRQYTSWRGQAQFEKEMHRMEIRHIRSQPHHPQTQGKIERFWKTIKEEFFNRTLFEGFEDMQARTKLWVQYYNFKRPHQGIGGLCPSDRFYEVSHEVRQMVEKGIADNILQMALQGEPRKPCYLVGRMDDQSVTVMAEQGRLKLSISDIEGQPTQEMVYPLSNNTEKNDITEGDKLYGKVNRDDETQAQCIDINTRGGEVPGSTVGVDGEAQACGGVPGVGGQVDDPHALAEACSGGNAAGAGAAAEPGAGVRSLSAPAGASGTPGEDPFVSVGGPSGIAPHGADSDRAGQAGQGRPEDINGNSSHAPEGVDHDGRSCPAAGEDHHAGLQRRLDGSGGCTSDGCLPEDVLRMGEPRSQGHDGSDGGRGGRQAGVSAGRPGEGGAQANAGRNAKGTLRCPGIDLCPACAGRVRSEACGGCEARR
jgi:transposase InsO family protein